MEVLFYHLDLLAIMFTSSDEEHEGRFGFPKFLLSTATVTLS